MIMKYVLHLATLIIPLKIGCVDKCNHMCLKAYTSLFCRRIYEHSKKNSECSSHVVELPKANETC